MSDDFPLPLWQLKVLPDCFILKLRFMKNLGTILATLAVVCFSATLSFAQVSATAEKERTIMIEIPIEGMGCMGCVGTITEAFEKEAGIRSVQVSLDDKSGTFEYVPEQTDPEKIKAKLVKLGYTPGEVKMLR